MKELFEKWVISHFGGLIEYHLDDFDEEEGYADQSINALWIGFNGHAILSEQRTNELENKLAAINEIIFAQGAHLGSDNYFKIRELCVGGKR